MTDIRMVAMTAEQAAEIETYIVALMRANELERASLMQALALQFIFAERTSDDAPANVVELHGYSKKVVI